MTEERNEGPDACQNSGVHNISLCKQKDICYNVERDQTKQEVLTMAKDERNTYTIQNDASKGRSQDCR